MQGRRTCGVKSLHLFTHSFIEQTPVGFLPGVAGPWNAALGVAGPWNAALGGTDSSVALGKQEMTLEKNPLGPCPQRRTRPQSQATPPQVAPRLPPAPDCIRGFKALGCGVGG